MSMLREQNFLSVDEYAKMSRSIWNISFASLSLVKCKYLIGKFFSPEKKFKFSQRISSFAKHIEIFHR